MSQKTHLWFCQEHIYDLQELRLRLFLLGWIPNNNHAQFLVTEMYSAPDTYNGEFDWISFSPNMDGFGDAGSELHSGLLSWKGTNPIYYRDLIQVIENKK